MHPAGNGRITSDVSAWRHRSKDKVKFIPSLSSRALLGRGLASDKAMALIPVTAWECRSDSAEENEKPIHNFYNTDGIWGGQWNLAQVWAFDCP